MATKSITSRVKSELSRDAIVERALAIADSEGLEAVTIRRVAADFDVTPMALYWHVRNKDELLSAMGQSFYRSLPLPTAGPWDEQLKAIVSALVASFRAHPPAITLATGAILTCADGQALTEYTLSVLVDAGFTVNEAADIARTALQTAVMLVVQETGGEAQAAGDERDALLAAKRQAILALPADRFPRLVAAADAFTSCVDDEAHVDFGVELFMAGVRSMRPA